MAKEYAVYKGDDLLCIGTVDECAQALDVTPRTILYYKYESYQRKGNSKKVTNRRITVPLD